MELDEYGNPKAREPGKGVFDSRDDSSVFGGSYNGSSDKVPVSYMANLPATNYAMQSNGYISPDPFGSSGSPIPDQSTIALPATDRRREDARNRMAYHDPLQGIVDPEVRSIAQGRMAEGLKRFQTIKNAIQRNEVDFSAHLPEYQSQLEQLTAQRDFIVQQAQQRQQADAAAMLDMQARRAQEDKNQLSQKLVIDDQNRINQIEARANLADRGIHVPMPGESTATIPGSPEGAVVEQPFYRPRENTSGVRSIGFADPNEDRGQSMLERSLERGSSGHASAAESTAGIFADREKQHFADVGADTSLEDVASKVEAYGADLINDKVPGDVVERKKAAMFTVYSAKAEKAQASKEYKDLQAKRQAIKENRSDVAWTQREQDRYDKHIKAARDKIEKSDQAYRVSSTEQRVDDVKFALGNPEQGDGRLLDQHKKLLGAVGVERARLNSIEDTLLKLPTFEIEKDSDGKVTPAGQKRYDEYEARLKVAQGEAQKRLDAAQKAADTFQREKIDPVQDQLNRAHDAASRAKRNAEPTRSDVKRYMDLADRHLRASGLTPSASAVMELARGFAEQDGWKVPLPGGDK